MVNLTAICAFKNAAPFLNTTLVSLEQAADDDMEFLFVDDGSTDGGAEIISDLGQRLPNCRVIQNNTSRGPAVSRNQMLDQANGETIAFIDGDDWVSADYLKTLRSTIVDQRCDFVRTDQIRVDGTKRWIHRAPDPRYFRPLDPRSAILPADRSTMVDFPYSHSGAFHRRLLDAGILHLPNELFTAEDRPWIWRLHLEAESYVRLPAIGYFYRRGNTGALTQVGDVRQLDFAPAFRQVFEVVSAHDDSEAYLPKAARQWFAIAHHHISTRKRLEPGLKRRLYREIRAVTALLDPKVRRDVGRGLTLERRRNFARIGVRL